MNNIDSNEIDRAFNSYWIDYKISKRIWYKVGQEADEQRHKKAVRVHWDAAIQFIEDNQ